jgi:hypothetical protein
VRKSYLMLSLAGCMLMSLSQPPRYQAQAQAQSQYPIVDKLADRVIQKYQTESCTQLKAQKEQPPNPQESAMKQKVVAQLRADPKMREHFLNRVAGPIANKLFECGMVP